MNTDSDGHKHETQVKKVDKLSATRVRLTIEMSPEAVSQHENHTTQRYLKQAKLPGFRPGKAPLSIIKQKYRDDIRRDVVSHLLEAGIGEALHSTQLSPLNRPAIEIKAIDFDKGGPLEFSAEFEVRPEIELKNYRGISLPNTVTEPTEAEISSTLDNLRERFAVLEPLPAEKVSKSQFAVVELSYDLSGEPKISQPTKQFTFEVGSGGLLPEIDSVLLDMKVGESRTVTAKFPIDYAEKSHAGRDGTFHLNFLEVKQKSLPELNDDFAKQVKDGSTLTALTTEVTETIRTNKKKGARKAERDAVLHYLVEKNPFEVPQSLVERQALSLIEGIQHDMKEQGFSTPPKLSAEDLENVKKRAEFLVRGSLLLQEVSVREKIELSEDTFQLRLKEIAARFERPPEETEKMLEGKGMTGRIKDDVLTDQVFEFLLKHAVIGR